MEEMKLKQKDFEEAIEESMREINPVPDFNVTPIESHLNPY